jgi:hypothetical protein
LRGVVEDDAGGLALGHHEFAAGEVASRLGQRVPPAPVR